MEPAKKIWIDGELVDWHSSTVHVLSPSLHYGIGVFEGVRAYRRQDGSSAVLRLRDHMRRLRRSAAICALNLQLSVAQACDATLTLLEANDLSSAYVRPLAYIPNGHMALAHNRSPVSVAIACWRWDDYMGAGAAQKGVRVMVSSWRHPDCGTAVVGAKATGPYLAGYLAKTDAVRAGYDEAIVLNRSGHVVEGTSQNIFIVRDGVVITPPLTDGCLPGITRDCVLRLAADHGLEVREASFTRSQLYDCDEAFLTGTLTELIPISEVDGRALETPGPVTRKLWDLFTHVTHDGDARYEHWFDRVG